MGREVVELEEVMRRWILMAVCLAVVGGSPLAGRPAPPVRGEDPNFTVLMEIFRLLKLQVPQTMAKHVFNAFKRTLNDEDREALEVKALFEREEIPSLELIEQAPWRAKALALAMYGPIRNDPRRNSMIENAKTMGKADEDSFKRWVEVFLGSFAGSERDDLESLAKFLDDLHREKFSEEKDSKRRRRRIGEFLEKRGIRPVVQLTGGELEILDGVLGGSCPPGCGLPHGQCQTPSECLREEADLVERSAASRWGGSVYPRICEELSRMRELRPQDRARIREECDRFMRRLREEVSRAQSDPRREAMRRLLESGGKP